ncbi:MAG: hypothetical protein ACLGPL_00665 [Acidobacteriota bacterium]
MQHTMYYHKCGHPILEVKRAVGPVQETCYLDANNPVNIAKDGAKSLRVIKECPNCGATIRAEKLLSQKPDVAEEKRPSGYIPARM